jgi:very-short-patch-repair endonuclease
LRFYRTGCNPITSKHVDFAVCDPKTLQVIGVIELDDSSHGETDRQRRDKFVDAALSSASVPLVPIPAHRAYGPADIRQRVSVLFATANPSFGGFNCV